MSDAPQMLASYPGSFGLDAELLADAIAGLTDCQQTCTASWPLRLSGRSGAVAVSW